MDNGKRTFQVIRMGPTLIAIWKDIVKLFEQQGKPLSREQRDEIAALHGRSEGAVVIARLRAKHALISDEATAQPEKDVVPRFRDMIVVDSCSDKVEYPDVVHGMGVEYAMMHLASQGADAPSSPDQKPIVLSLRLSRAYEALLGFARTSGFTSMDPSVIWDVLRKKRYDDSRIVADLERKGLLIRSEKQVRIRGKLVFTRTIVDRPFRFVPSRPGPLKKETEERLKAPKPERIIKTKEDLERELEETELDIVRLTDHRKTLERLIKDYHILTASLVR